MSEKPQEDRPEDLLEQIFTQGLEKIKAPQQATDPGDGLPEIAAAPEPEDGEGPAPAANRKNRRSAVTPCLLILFGAAFLILLLAYFVQRRSSEDTLGDLQGSMNLLLEQIRTLEEENAALERQNDTLNSWGQNYELTYIELQQELEMLEQQIQNLQAQQARLQEQLTDARQKANDYEAMYDSRTNDLERELIRADALANLWAADYLYRTEQYEECAASLVTFNEGIMSILPPEALDRALEICQGLTNRDLLNGELVSLLEHYIAGQDTSRKELYAFSTP